MQLFVQLQMQWVLSNEVAFRSVLNHCSITVGSKRGAVMEINQAEMQAIGTLNSNSLIPNVEAHKIASCFAIRWEIFSQVIMSKHEKDLEIGLDSIHTCKFITIL